MNHVGQPQLLQPPAQNYGAHGFNGFHQVANPTNAVASNHAYILQLSYQITLVVPELGS